MAINISFTKAPYKKAEGAVLCFYEGKEASASVNSLDYELHGYIDHVVEKSKSFKGKSGQIEVLMLPENAPYGYAILLGLGKKEKFTKMDAEKVGGKLVAALDGKNIESLEFFVDNELSDSGELTAHIALGMHLRSYKFDLYKTKKEDEDDTYC